MAKCTYCKKQIADGCALEVCDSCGIRVWGQKMYNAIKNNMQQANAKGDLFQGGN